VSGPVRWTGNQSTPTDPRLVPSGPDGDPGRSGPVRRPAGSRAGDDRQDRPGYIAVME